MNARIFQFQECVAIEHVVIVKKQLAYSLGRCIVSPAVV